MFGKEALLTLTTCGGFVAIFPLYTKQKHPISMLCDAEVEYTEPLKRPTAQSTEKKFNTD